MLKTENLFSTTAYQAGFTLIELMIVVTIAGIVALLAIPFMQDTIATQRARAASTEMHLSLLLARSEAIKRNGNIDVVRSGATWEGGWQVKSGATVLRTSNPFSTVTIDCLENGATCDDTLTFLRSGRPDQLVEVSVYNPDNTKVQMRCVEISLSGRPSVELDTDDDTTNGCN